MSNVRSNIVVVFIFHVVEISIQSEISDGDILEDLFFNLDLAHRTTCRILEEVDETVVVHEVVPIQIAHLILHQPQRTSTAGILFDKSSLAGKENDVVSVFKRVEAEDALIVGALN